MPDKAKIQHPFPETYEAIIENVNETLDAMVQKGFVPDILLLRIIRTKVCTRLRYRYTFKGGIPTHEIIDQAIKQQLKERAALSLPGTPVGASFPGGLRPPKRGASSNVAARQR